MTTVDVIMPSNGRERHLIKMTQNCIDSLHESENNIEFNILVFEQQPTVNYQNAKTIHYSYPFNYNKIMNDGIGRTSSPYVCMANNDLLFSYGWCSELLKWTEQYMSMSPRCPKAQMDMKLYATYEGYGISKELSGWCIFIKRELLDIIGALDESMIFWFSDNVYADALQEHGIKHALISNSIVRHLTSKTVVRVGVKNLIQYTTGQKKIYAEKKKCCSEHPCDLQGECA
jgi:GT2 family glycosyltransferase